MGPASFCVAGAGLGALELLLHGRSVRGVLGAAFAWQVRRFDCFGTAAGLMMAVGPGEPLHGRGSTWVLLGLLLRGRCMVLLELLLRRRGSSLTALAAPNQCTDLNRGGCGSFF